VYDEQPVTGAARLISRPGKHGGVLVQCSDADDDRPVHGYLLKRKR
jgi:hypothetical protein